VLLVTALSAPWWFNARRVADLAFVQADKLTSLDWSYAGEPVLRWRPQPWLSLPGLQARDSTGRVVLAAKQFDIAVPWSTLRGEAPQVDALRVVGPEVNLDAALDWWNAQPPGGEATAPQLDGLVITRGRVHWAGGALEGIELNLPRFALDEAVVLDLRGTVAMAAASDNAAAARVDAAPPPFDIAISLRAMPRAAPWRLDAFTLGVSGTGPVPSLTASGGLQFAPWQLQAAGDIASWPSDWPALPAPLSESSAPMAFTLTQQGESALGAEAAVTLVRDAVRFEARGIPEAALAWLDDADAAALPPLSVRATLPVVELDGVRLEGVTVELDETP
jgi:hypothetical protein